MSKLSAALAIDTQLRVSHVPIVKQRHPLLPQGSGTVCARCDQDWPCDTRVLLDALDEARTLLAEAARDLGLLENFQDETLRGRINEALGRG